LNEHTSEVDKTQGVRYNVPTVIREEGFEVRIYTFTRCRMSMSRRPEPS